MSYESTVPSPPSPFLRGLGMGLAAPFVSLAFAGLGGGVGYLVALAIFVVAALCLGQLRTFAGVIAGLGITCVVGMGLLMYAMRDF